MPPRSPAAAQSPRLRIALALAAVYLIWGSTYLGVHVALASFPPVLLVGLRYGLAGALMYGWLRWRGVPAPTRDEWRGTSVIGALLAIGSASTAYALCEVPTGVTAIACGSIPLWSALFARIFGDRSSGREWLGLLVGLAGVLLLNARGELRAHGAAALVLWIGSLSWSFGSVASRRARLPGGPMASASQMMTGGFLVVGVALAKGERLTAVPSTAGLIAFVYLVSIGSIVAYSAYVYLLGRVRPTVATSYAYVNPIVALALGAMFMGESLSGWSAVAAVAILGGVALMGTGTGPGKAAKAIGDRDGSVDAIVASEAGNRSS